MAVIGAFALEKFLRILDPSGTPNGEDEMLDKLCNSPSWIRELLDKTDVGTPPLASSLTELMQWTNEATDMQYDSNFDRLQQSLNAATNTLTADVALHIGEAVIMCAMEGGLRDHIVMNCMEQLDEDTMLDLQRAIQRWKRDETSSFDEEISEGPPPDERGPAYDTQQTLKELVTRRRSGKHEEEPHATDRSRLEVMRRQFHGAEAAREELQLQLDKAKKEIQTMQISHSIAIAELKAASATKKTSAVTELEHMEREIETLRAEKEKLARQALEQEKSLVSQIDALKDEGQLLQAEARKAEQLEHQMQSLRKRLTEAEGLKDTINVLEQKCNEWMQRAVTAESGTGKEVKIMVDTYKRKLHEAEEKSSEAQVKIAELDATLEVRGRELATAAKQQRVADLRLEAVIAEYESRLAESQQKPTLDLQERLLRLEKENEMMRQEGQSTDSNQAEQLVELQCSLEAAQRREEKLERDCKAVLARAALLESQGGGDPLLQLRLVEKEKELAVMAAELEASRVKLQSLESRIEQERHTAGLQEGVLKARLEAQQEQVNAQLREELRRSENRVKYFVIQRNEQAEVHRREQGFMAAAFHELGIRYIKMRQNCESLESQLEAIKMKASNAANKRKRKSTSHLAESGGLSRSMASSHFSND